MAFSSLDAWGFSVLGCLQRADRDVAVVNRNYRSLMKKLHPDRVGSLPGCDKATEAVREAKDICIRKLSRQKAPGRPTDLRFKVISSEIGCRRILLEWSPPFACESAQLRRYVVAAFDPSFGKALTVTVLEPDYSEQLRRFVALEDLCSYELREEDLRKMPALFRQAEATLQVAAANEAGQSEWSQITLPLNAMAGAEGSAVSPWRPGPTAPGRKSKISCGIQADKVPRAKAANQKRRIG
jgi:hypothetical protein